MALPKKLYNFDLIVDGTPLRGTAEEITLPTLERNVEDYRGASMLAPVEVDLGINKLTLDVTLAEHHPAIMQHWGMQNGAGLGLRFLSIATADDATSNDAIEITVRGRLTKWEAGSVKPGELNKPKFSMGLQYYKYMRNGKNEIEIDAVSGKEIVHGKDRSADTFKFLGLQ